MAVKTRLIPTVYARSLIAVLCYRGLLNARSQRWVPFLKLEEEMFYLQELVAPGQVAIDIGANVGIYTGWLARLVGTSGRVLAVEPYPPVFEKLVRNVHRMHATNVTTFNEAIGDETGWTSLELPSSRGGSVNDPYIHIKAGSGLGGDVPMSTIDEIARRESLDRVNLIKVDVEGYERFVINGARATIRRFHPLILVEIFDRWAMRYSSGFREVDEMLADLDYSGYLLDKGRLSRVRGPPPTTSRNFFYMPNAPR